jgi:signal transduction histidine kinase
MARVLDSPPAVLPRRKTRLSLRTKGVITLAFFLVCILATGLFVAHERRGLVDIVREMEASDAAQAMLTSVLKPLTHSLVETQALLDASDAVDTRYPDYELLAEHIRPVLPALGQARQTFPQLDRDVGQLMMAVVSLRASVHRAELTELRDREQGLIVKMHDIVNGLQDRSRNLAQEYRDSQGAITTVIVSAHVIGAGGSLAMILIFFTRMSKDIRRLQERAFAIVSGYAGPPLQNTRSDEIGELIEAVNRMQVDLRRFEQQQEVGRQQRFHQEKMAAVGSLAAAIGHEVSNPIAAISGVAQFMVDETRAQADPKSKRLNEFAAEIASQAQRIALILRQMSSLTTPPSPEAKLLDLNALIQSTASFIRYDKRFRGIEFDLTVDAELPAVMGVADHLTQILMNLLINAADAMEDAAREGRGRIGIVTRRVEGGVEVAVCDNGRGMSAEVLARAFQESFTTKPAGRGRGIGLFLCKTLMEEAGGRIALESTPEIGTTATLFLPVDPAPGS